MEKYIAAVLFAAITSGAQAEVFKVEIPHQCTKTEKMFEYVTKIWKEEPIAMGKENVDTNGERAVVSVWSNSKTKTLTVLHTSKIEGISCIMAAAENVDIIIDKKMH